MADDKGSIVGFDVTVSLKENRIPPADFSVKLKEVFKKWVFQEERGESTDYPHYQIRGHLYKRKTVASGKVFLGKHLCGHVTPTTTGVHENNSFNYCMKADTRVDGPWKDTDEEFDDPPPLTRQLRDFYNKIGPDKAGMYPWQTQLLELVKQVDDRMIKCIIDDGAGNNGKSIFAEYLEYERLAYEVPPMTCMQDIMQCCMGIRGQKCYVVDMPRAMKKEKLAGFYSGLEALKNGIMYDPRYAFKKRRIDRPQIIVFTNTFPDRALLSPDRWAMYYMVDRDLKLVD